MKYRDKKWEFELDLPPGWHRASFFRRLKHKGAPEFFGPRNDTIKFAIGPITPVPDYREHMENLRRIANQHDHEVLSVGSIEVEGKQHATIKVAIPSPFGGPLNCKHYGIICEGIEFFISATLASGESAIDSIIKTFART